jgi:CheY-like chemotaxis protein/DNA-binding MarR family transcriptional regulator
MQDYEVCESRDSILSYISNHPGKHMRRISRELGISLSTLRYHLHKLEKDGLIHSEKQDNFRVYFASGKLKPEEKVLAHLLQQQRFRDIILILIDYPGSTSSDIAEKLSMSPSTLSKYIKILENRNVISFCLKSNKKIYCLNNEHNVVSFLKTYRQIMSNMSYEIRNPMNAIMGMASLLLEDDITEEKRELVETIRISSDALMTIVNDILGFSMIQLDGAELEIKVFGLRECIEDALQSVATRAALKDIEMAYEIDNFTPEVIIGDLGKLRQVLIQLISRAVNFTNKGEIIVSVSSIQLESFHEIHFAIKSSIIDISAENIDPFLCTDCKSVSPLQEERKIEARELPNYKDLIELMGGRFWTEGAPGQGSTIHFTIKRKQITKISPLSGVQLHLSGKRLLIIHSSKTIGKIIEAQAAQWGMIPSSTSDPQEALRLLSSNERFNVALLDTNISKNYGPSLQDDIRRIDNSLPLVALAFSSPQIKSAYESILTKPIRQMDLFKALSGALAGTQPVCEPHEKPIARADACVLVAEDNVSNQKVIVSMLKKLGYSADAVSNGREALEALERKNYRFVIMDVKMPKMDGLEATRLIREKLQSGIKIIAITAYALKGDKERCLEAGMDDYISKPIRIEDLEFMLKKHNFI